MATKELFTGIVQNADSMPVFNRFGRDATALFPNVEDLKEDLSELRRLVDDLQETASLIGIDCSPSIDVNRNDANFSLTSVFSRSVDNLLTRHRRTYESLERASKFPAGEKLPAVLENVRKQYLSIKTDTRAAYRLRGTLLCQRDWQSPIYASSIPLGSNRLADGIAEHVLDYKRDGHLDAQAYEEQFIAQYVNHLEGKRPQAYLTNSGMGAFTTVLHWLAHEVQMGAVAVGLKPMYFENLHLSQQFFPNMVQMQAPSSAELLNCLQAENPSVVFCDIVSNCGEVVTHDVETILKWAVRDTEHQLAIVIDTTCLPSVLLPAGLWKNIPDRVTIILVESLAKFHQFGMDVVTGGVVIMDAEQSLHDSFKKTRARLGTNIADGSVGSLPLPNRELLTRRLQRHSRNTIILAERLERIARETTAAVIESVSWQTDGTTTAPWYRSSCLSIRLHKPFRSIKRYREFEQKVLELCCEQGVPLALGTSFGFDVTRFYVTAPSTPFEDPFLRVSVGTETYSQMEKLADILAVTNQDLARQWGSLTRDSGTVRAERGQSAGARIIPVGRAPGDARQVNETAALMRGGVFIGEDALKNYLHPANYAATPLVELPDDLNPYRADGVRIMAKIVPLVPLMNIKSIPAFSMLSKASQRGELQAVENVIESSSSNTVLSLSVVARLFGIENTHAIVDHSIAPSLTRMLRLFGIEILLHPAAGHHLFGKLQPRSERARQYGAQAGWINPGQYSNPDNPEGFAQYLAPELWKQTQGRLQVLSCALGTCGTMVGVSRALREKNPQLQVVANCPQAGDAVPGPREKSLLADVSFDWHHVANACLELPAEESFAASVKLLRRGVLGGPSSGMNYAGLLRYVQELKESGSLTPLLNERGELWCAFLCCDSPLPHVDEYYDALAEEYFPVVHPVPEAE